MPTPILVGEMLSRSTSLVIDVAEFFRAALG